MASGARTMAVDDAGGKAGRASTGKKVHGRPQRRSDPGMLAGRILRSPHPHARVVSVDIERAERLPGVVAVAQPRRHRGPGRDRPAVGRVYRDQAVVAIDKVRFIGEPVAAVVAVDEDVAAEALELIDVDYEPLPAVFDPVRRRGRTRRSCTRPRSSRPTAFARHGAPRPGGRATSATSSRCAAATSSGVRRADYVFEDTYTTPPAQHATLEPHVTWSSSTRTTA